MEKGESEGIVVVNDGEDTYRLSFPAKTGELVIDHDIEGKANKDEMSITPGTGADADKTTIQLKQGTSTTVLTSHQSLDGVQ